MKKRTSAEIVMETAYKAFWILLSFEIISKCISKREKEKLEERLHIDILCARRAVFRKTILYLCSFYKTFSLLYTEDTKM
jgi:hypothetical protein